MFLNFGRFFGFGFQSKMDTLLKQDNLTLETIFNEDDILSELKSQSSGKFADFIIQHPNEYIKMINYITNDVSDKESNLNKCIKYPFYTSEILGSENEKLINFLFEKQGDTSQEEIQNPLDDLPKESQQDNEKLRQKLLPDLLSFLQNDSLMITSAGYFTKIISAIIHKRGYDFWEYVKSNPEIISNLFKHANIRHITEIFEKLIILDTCQEEHEERLFIQERQSLLARLLKYLKGQTHQNIIITNVCESLIEIYKRAIMSLEGMVVLREILLTNEKPEFFMNLAIQTQNSSVYNLLNIQYEFYNKISQLEDVHYDIQFSTLYKPILDESTKALIQQDLFKASFQTTYGAKIKPLGDSKLSLIQLIVQLIQKQELAIIIQKGQIFQQVINLVFDYQTNNQLHILFEKMIVAIIDSKNAHLHELFFEDTNFLNSLIKNNGLEERRKKHGYQGILTKITNYINSPNILQQCEIVQIALSSIQNEWLKYIQELKEVNDIEQTWLLGVNPRFREQINVDSFSPPLILPDPLGSNQYKSTNDPNSQTNDNQQDSQEDNNNENQEYVQQADQFDQEQAQIEKEMPVEVLQVKEENIEQQDEQQPQKHEVQILDSPVYVQNDQTELLNQDIPELVKEQQPQQIQEEQENVEKQEESNQQSTEQQNELNNEQQTEQQNEQPKEQQNEQPKEQQIEEPKEQQNEQLNEQQNEQLNEQQNEKQNQQQNEQQIQQQQQNEENQDQIQEQQDQHQEEPKEVEQQIQQQPQVEQQEPETENHQVQDQQEQHKQPIEEP